MLSAKKFLIPAVAALVAFGAPAVPAALADHDSATAAEEGKTKKKKRGSCAFRRNLRNFSVIDDQHFVLESGSRDFLVTLSPGCHRLNFNIAIAIKSTPAAGLCVTRGDRVIVDHSFTCFIRQIEQVEDREEAKKLVKARKEAEEEEKEKSGERE